MVCMATARDRHYSTSASLADPPVMRSGDRKGCHDNSQVVLPLPGCVNYRRKTACACCAWRPQGIATTLLRLRKAIHPAMWGGNRKGCHDKSQALSMVCMATARDRHYSTSASQGDPPSDVEWQSQGLP